MFSKPESWPVEQSSYRIACNAVNSAHKGTKPENKAGDKVKSQRCKHSQIVFLQCVPRDRTSVRSKTNTPMKFN
jgi:hypothetical protein